MIDAYLRLSSEYSGAVGPGESLFDDPQNTGGLLLQAFIPTRSPTTNLNNHSTVLVVTYAGSKIILPGDNEAPSWQELLGRPDFREAIQGTDVLIAPHHDRLAGFSPELFQHIAPRLVIISDGPVQTTNAANDYRKATHDEGWKVHSRHGESKTRYVLTTRTDGVVALELGQGSTGRNYLSVTAD